MKQDWLNSTHWLGDGMTDRRTDRWADGGTCSQFPHPFCKKHGDNNGIVQILGLIIMFTHCSRETHERVIGKTRHLIRVSTVCK